MTLDCTLCGACCRYMRIPSWLFLDIDWWKRHGCGLNEGYLILPLVCDSYDTVTGLCVDQDNKPQTCVDYEIGGVACLRSRMYEGVSE